MYNVNKSLQKRELPSQKNAHGYSVHYNKVYSDTHIHSTQIQLSDERVVNSIRSVYFSGYCFADEFSCDNGRCVGNSVTCNGYNPCGDHSDCSSHIDVHVEGGVVAGIVVGGVVFTAFIVLVVIIALRRRRYRYVIIKYDNFMLLLVEKIFIKTK